MIKKNKTKKLIIGFALFLFLILIGNSYNAFEEMNGVKADTEMPKVANNTTWDSAIPLQFEDQISFSLGNGEERWYSFEMNGTYNNYSLAFFTSSLPNTTANINLTVYGPDDHSTEVGTGQEGTYSNIYYHTGAAEGTYYVNISADGIDYIYEAILRFIPYNTYGGLNINEADPMTEIFGEDGGDESNTFLDQPRFFKVYLPANLQIEIMYGYGDCSDVDLLNIYGPDKSSIMPFDDMMTGVSPDPQQPFLLMNVHNFTTTEGEGYYYFELDDLMGEGILPILKVQYTIPIEEFEPSLEMNDEDTDLQYGEVSLTWDEHVEAEEFYIYRDTQPITDISSLEEIDIVSYHHYYEQHSNNGDYYYRVVAAKDGGTTFSLPSNEIQATISYISFDQFEPNLVKNEFSTNTSTGSTFLMFSTALHPEGETYNIYRDTQPIADISGMSPQGTSNEYNSFHEKISINGTYYYRATAVKDGGETESALSNQVSFDINIMPFDQYAPFGLNIDEMLSDSEDGTIQMSWDMDTGKTHPHIENYSIYRDTQPITDISGLDEIVNTSNNFFQDRVTESGNYYYRVVALKDDGMVHSALSNQVSFTVNIPDFEIFTPILDLQDNTLLETGDIHLNWTEHIQVEEYLIYRDTQSIIDIDNLTPLGSVSGYPSYFDSIHNEGTYHYRVHAIKNGGSDESQLSNEIQITTDMFDSNPIISKEPSFTDPNTGNITIEWTAIPNVDEYYIYRDDSPINEIENLSEYAVVSDVNFSEQITVENTYYYRVLAKKTLMLGMGGTKDVFSAPSNELTFTTSFFSGSPTLTLKEDFCNSNTGDIAINWTEIAEADEYYIYRDIYPIDDSSSLSEIDNISDTEYSESIPVNMTWYYRIRAMKIIDGTNFYSELSNEINFEVIIPAYLYNPSIELDVEETESMLGKIRFTWEDHPDADGYYVYRETEPIDDVKNFEVYWGLSEPNFSETIFMDGKYYYRIIAHKNEGLSLSKQSNQIIFDVNYDPFNYAPEITIDQEFSNSETGEITIVWDEHPDAESYNIYRDTQPIVDPESQPTHQTVSWNSFFEEISMNGTYYYRICAVKDNGNSLSNLSNEVTFTVNIPSEGNNNDGSNGTDDEGTDDEVDDPAQYDDGDDQGTDDDNTSDNGEDGGSGNQNTGIPGYPISFLLLFGLSMFAIVLKRSKNSMH